MIGWLVYQLLNAVAGDRLRRLARSYTSPPRLETKDQEQQ